MTQRPVTPKDLEPIETFPEVMENGGTDYLGWARNRGAAARVHAQADEVNVRFATVIPKDHGVHAMKMRDSLSPTELATYAFQIQCPRCDKLPGRPCESTQPHKDREREGVKQAFSVAAAAVGRSGVSIERAMRLYETGMTSFTLRDLLTGADNDPAPEPRDPIAVQRAREAVRVEFEQQIATPKK